MQFFLNCEFLQIGEFSALSVCSRFRFPGQTHSTFGHADGNGLGDEVMCNSEPRDDLRNAPLIRLPCQVPDAFFTYIYCMLLFKGPDILGSQAYTRQKDLIYWESGLRASKKGRSWPQSPMSKKPEWINQSHPGIRLGSLQAIGNGFSPTPL